MIVDSSALLAILKEEADSGAFLEAITASERCAISAANFLEVAIITDARAPAAASHELDAFVERVPITIEPVTLPQMRLARQAYARFGKGNHPARLNFGDCFAYALAKETGRPLLFKGGDFAKTDISPALPAS